MLLDCDSIFRRLNLLLKVVPFTMKFIKLKATSHLCNSVVVKVDRLFVQRLVDRVTRTWNC